MSKNKVWAMGMILIVIASFVIFNIVRDIQNDRKFDRMMLFANPVAEEMKRNNIPTDIGIMPWMKKSPDPSTWTIPARGNLAATQADEVWCVIIETGAYKNDYPPIAPGEVSFVLARQNESWYAQIVHEGFYPLDVDTVFSSLGCDRQ